MWPSSIKSGLIFIIKHWPQSTMKKVMHVYPALNPYMLPLSLHSIGGDVECEDRIQYFISNTNVISLDNIYHCFNPLLKFVCEGKNCCSWHVLGRMLYIFVFPSLLPCLKNLATPHIGGGVGGLVWRNIYKPIWLSKLFYCTKEGQEVS